MKLLSLFSVMLILASCQKSEVVSDFTGTQATYALTSGSEYNVSGTITFKERKDGFTTVVVSLTNTDGDLKLPVHLHLGDISKADADVALLLNPADSKTGRSETIVTSLADDSKVTFKDLLKLSACVKVHLSESGPGRQVILAAGNIGSNSQSVMAGARLGIGVCKSN